jgi:hypothetical protein
MIPEPMRSFNRDHVLHQKAERTAQLNSLILPGQEWQVFSFGTKLVIFDLCSLLKRKRNTPLMIT